MAVLSPSQKRAEDFFRDFVLNETEDEMVISGFAGSGKTFLVKRLKEVNEKQMDSAKIIFGAEEGSWKTFYTATTNKAALVLQQNVWEPTRTIHSLLGLKVKNNFKKGKTELTRTDRTRPLGKCVVFIDEASMISRDLLDIIRECKTPGKTKLVFIGDKYQLAPVEEGHSPVFRRPRNLIELKEIQRQVAGSPIIQTSQTYRKIMETGLPFSWPEIKDDLPAIEVVQSGQDFKTLIDQHYLQDHGPNDVKVLAWTNNKVVRYNQYIRSLHTSSSDFEVGERVMTNNPIMSTLKKDEVVHGTDDIVEITWIEPFRDPTDGFDGWKVEVNKGVKRFMPRDWSAVKKRMSHYWKSGDFTNYFRIKDTFLDLRSLHALTVHKSQGSTYQTVFVDVEDIGTNKKWQEQCRLLYVAISRASTKVYLHGEQKMMKWSKTGPIF